MDTVRDVLRCFRGPQVAPPSSPSHLLSILSHPSLRPSRDATRYPSFFSHPLYFLFSSPPRVPTDNRKKMKGGKGALCLSLSPPAYFSGFILVVWPCLSPSYYSRSPVTPGARVPPSPTNAQTPYLMHTHSRYAQMHCLTHTHTHFPPHAFSVSFSL